MDFVSYLRGNSKSFAMAPPPNIPNAVHPVLREVTEDTPPDLLEGQMDLLVVLPSKKMVRMTVPRRTPMMDLLIQVTTQNKINPGGHIVQVRNDVGIIMKYKPSTPIGALDTTQIEIVPKNQVNEYIIVKKQTAKIANQPFETTTRLQVHLPRNQLYVMRVTPKTLLQDILQEVCQEKNLDFTRYELRHSVNLDEKLPLDQRIGDFSLSEVTVVSRNSRVINSSVSTADIMALQNEEGRSKLDSAFKHSRSSVGGDSSMSSESAASARGISPSRSDDSRSISPLPPVRPKLKLNSTMSNASSSSGVSSSAVPKSQFQNQIVKSPTSSTNNNTVVKPPIRKKRAAPPPPTLVSGKSNSNVDMNSPSPVPSDPVNNSNCIRQTTSVVASPTSTTSPHSTSVVSPPIRPTPRKKEPPLPPYSARNQTLPINHSRHSSDSSGYHENEVQDNPNQIHRFDRQQSVPVISNLHSPHQRVSGSLSVSNLTTVSSISSTSLASSNGGIRKRKAPRPPNLQGPVLQAQKEIDEEFSLSISASTTTGTDSETSSLISQAAEPLSTPCRHNSGPTNNHVLNKHSSNSSLNNNNNNKLLDSRSRETSLEEVEVKVDVHQESSSSSSTVSRDSGNPNSVHKITVDLEQESSSSPLSTVQEKSKNNISSNSITSSVCKSDSSDNKEVLKSQKESNNYNNSSTDQPLSLETSSLPPSSASSLSSPGSSSGSTSSSPLPSTIEEAPPSSAPNAIVASSSSSQEKIEKHSIKTPDVVEEVLGAEAFPINGTPIKSPPSPSPSSSSSVVLENISRAACLPASSSPPVNVETSTSVASRLNNNTPETLVNSSSSSSTTTASSSSSAEPVVDENMPSAPPRKPRTKTATADRHSVGATSPLSINNSSHNKTSQKTLNNDTTLSSSDVPPKPKPRPRSLHSTTVTTDNNGSTNSSTLNPSPIRLSSTTLIDVSEEKKVQPSQSQFNVNRIGVKVFPDNALQERVARISKGDLLEQSRNQSESNVSSTTTTTTEHRAPERPERHPPPVRSSSSISTSSRPSSKKSRAPNPHELVVDSKKPSLISTNSSSSNSSAYSSSTNNNNNSSSKSVPSPTNPTPLTDVPKIEPQRKKIPLTDSLKSASSHDRSTEKPELSTTNATSMSMNKNYNQNLTRNVIQEKERGRSPSLGLSSESDDLEENLELFENPNQSHHQEKRKNDNKTIDNEEKGGNNNNSNNNNKNNNSNVDSKKILVKKRIAPTPQMLSVSSNSRSTNGPIKSESSASEVLGKNPQKNGHSTSSPNDEAFPYEFERTVSDRYLQKKSKLHGAHAHGSSDLLLIGEGSTPVHHTPDIVPRKQSSLNRWQNFDSLHEIEKNSVASSRTNIHNNTNSRTKTVMSKTQTNINTNNSNHKPTISSSSTSSSQSRLKKVSLSSTTSDSDDNHVVGVRDTQIQDVLLSSESEASYTDSGIPATEITTPSPIDIDMERSEKDVSSVASSRRSSIHSIDEEQAENESALREILQSKIENEQEIVDKAFEGIEVDAIDMDNHNDDGTTERMSSATRSNNFEFTQPSSMISKINTTSAASSPRPTTETDDEERDGAFSSNDEEKELKFSSGAEDHDSLSRRERSSTEVSTENDKSLSSAPATSEPSETGANSTKQPVRKLSKSESFSHKSEFDAVKMKRKMFSKEGKLNAVRKSYVSSSDDEDHSGKDQRKSSGNLNATTPNGRAGSMQNLSSQVDRNQKNLQQQTVNNRRNLESSNASSIDNKSNVSDDNDNSRIFRKATSVMNIQDMDQSIAQNPELMASFQTELEAQFEQWKQQFLQKHLGGSKSDSFDSNTDQVDGEVIKKEASPTVVQSKEEIGNKSEAELNDVEGDVTRVINGTTEAQVHLPKVVETREKSSVNKNIVDNSEPQKKQQVIVEKLSSSPSPIVHSEAETLTALHSHVLTKESTSVQSSKSLVNEEKELDSFDPERPQIIHSVATTFQHKKEEDQQQQSSDTLHQKEVERKEYEQREKSSIIEETTTTSTQQVSQTDAHLVDSVQTQVVEEKHQKESSSQDTMPVEAQREEEEVEKVTLREKKVKSESNDEPPKVYKYTGPPSIQMGTWGERPKSRQVSVKRDNDYIMGMGQQDTSARPALGSVAKRIHSFAGVPVNQPVASATLPRSNTINTSLNEKTDKNSSVNGSQNQLSPTSPVATAAAAPSRSKSIASVYTMNALGSSFDSSSSATLPTKTHSLNNQTNGSVISGLKQRLHDQQVEKEKERQQQSSHQSSLELSEASLNTESSALENQKRTSNNNNNNGYGTLEKTKKFNSITESNGSNGTSSTSPSNGNNTPVAMKISSYGDSRKVLQQGNSFQGNDTTDSTSDYSSNSRPTSSLSRVPSNASTINSNVTVGSMSDVNSTNSSPVPPSSSGPNSFLWEKKKFFQGVKPVESNGKETPIPAQNLKGNIATIQKVFEQRQLFQQQQQQQNQQPTVQPKPSFSSPVSKESSPAPSVSFGNNNSNSPISSTMMVQKVMRASSFNVEAFRRTPSPSTSSISSNTSFKSDERSNATPSPVQAAPEKISINTNQNRNRFTIGEQPSKSDDSSTGGNIKHVGNKSIIIVGNDEANTNINNNNNNSHNIFKQQLKVTSSPSPAVLHSNSNSTKINITGAAPSNNEDSKTSSNTFKVQDNSSKIIKSNQQQSETDGVVFSNNRDKNVILKKSPTSQETPSANITIHSIGTSKVSSIAANLSSNNSGFFSSLQRQPKQQQPQQSPLNKTNSKSTDDKPIIIEQLEKSRKTNLFNNNTTSSTPAPATISNTTPIKSGQSSADNVPPPPPPMIPSLDNVKLRPVSLGVSKNPKSNQAGPNKVTSPTSPSGDPRSEIFDAIKNKQFGLRKTNSSMLLK